MSFGDLLEQVISADWCRAWVLVRAGVVLLLVIAFPNVFQHLINWYAHWKSAGWTHEFQQAVNGAGPRPKPST